MGWNRTGRWVGASWVGACTVGLAAAVWAQEAQEVQEVTGVTELQKSAAIVISSDQDGGAPGGIVVMSSEGDDGGGPVFQSFSLGTDAGGGMVFGNSGPNSVMRLGGGGLQMFDPNNWGSLLNIPEIRQELDIMDAQVEEITQARKDLEKQIREQVNKMMEGGFDPSKAKEMAEMMRTQRAAIDEQISQQLLPGQVKRLREVALRLQMKQAGTVGMLGRKDIMEALEITPEQLEALKKKSVSLDEELKKRMEELKKKAHSELLGELKPEQRQKLEEMLGKDFDYQAPEFAPGAGRRISGEVTPSAPAAPNAPAAPRGGRFELRSRGK